MGVDDIREIARKKWEDIPDHSIGFSSAIGFVFGLTYWLALSVINGELHLVNLLSLMTWLIAMVSVLILGTMLNKWRMKERWSNRHWLERVMTVLNHSCYGIVAASIAYDVFVYILRR